MRGGGTASCWSTACATARGAGTGWPPCSDPPATASPRLTWPAVAPARGAPTRWAGSFEEYSRPLLDALPPGERAVLVGHSYGGLSLALAMQAHPDRVAVAVFASAAMPAAGKPMRFVSEQLREQASGPGFFKDCVTETSAGDDARQRPCSTFLLGPEYMAERLYQLSPPEDLTLATMLVRPTRQFTNDDAEEEEVLTAERYGAVSRVYVVAEEDACCSPEFQRRMASWSPGTEVRGLEGADHMPMFSKPRELSDLLLEIADKYD